MLPTVDTHQLTPSRCNDGPGQLDVEPGNYARVRPICVIFIHVWTSVSYTPS